MHKRLAGECLLPTRYDIKKIGMHLLYMVCVLGLGFFLIPLGLSPLFSGIPVWVMVFGVFAGGALSGSLTARYCPKPQGFWPRYWPMVLLTLPPSLVLVAGMLVSQGSTQGFWYMSIFFSPGFFVAFIIESLTRGLVFSPVAPVLYAFSYGAGFMWFEQRRPGAVVIPRWISPAVLVLLVALVSSGTLMYWQRSQHFVPRAYNFIYERGYSSVDLWPYHVHNPKNILPVLSSASSFRVEKREDMPILDGAEAAFPVYATFAKNCYANLVSAQPQDSTETVEYPRQLPNPYEQIVTFTNTINAFMRLLHGDVDIFFGAEPSAEQRQLAADRGLELVLTPIGKEAFVFFVGEDNPLTSLSQEQLRNIYDGSLRNWKKLGGRDVGITAYQRPEGSGSQTIMKKFMGAVPLARPLKQEVISGMGGVIEKTAAYVDMPGAIGYSFRFFATRMSTFSTVHLLELDGVAPTPENITNGTYPWVVPLYAITLKSNTKPAVLNFVAWMQGGQGQELVEAVGYSRYFENR